MTQELPQSPLERIPLLLRLEEAALRRDEAARASRQAGARQATVTELMVRSAAYRAADAEFHAAVAALRAYHAKNGMPEGWK